MTDLHLTPEAKKDFLEKKIQEFRKDLDGIQRKHGLMIISTLSYQEGALIPLTRVVGKDWDKVPVNVSASEVK